MGLENGELEVPRRFTVNVAIPNVDPRQTAAPNLFLKTKTTDIALTRHLPCGPCPTLFFLSSTSCVV
jgi:hypothetical protein